MKKNIKALIKRFAFILLAMGFDCRRIIDLRHLTKYIFQRFKYINLGGKITHHYPILSEYNMQAGSAKGHYFHQDLLVASFIYNKTPNRHIDIGSRIDGFVAHVAAFRKIELIDVRDLSDTGHKNISFIRADLMDKSFAKTNAGLSDSISCLHAIEHFGLGRYGDPLDPNGHIKGFNNILTMLADKGTLYISFPIGQSTQTFFNAHRVFEPKDIFSWSNNPDEIKLERFDYVDDEGSLHKNVNIHCVPSNMNFGCGIYTFQKLINQK
jgi:hypothetical protein